MAEPTTTAGISLTALAVALLGPLAGPYALIIFAALAGALWPLSMVDTETRRAGAWLLVRCTLTAVVLTGVVAAVISTQWGYAPSETLAPVAFFIGALGNGWRPVFTAVGGAISAVVTRLGSKT